MTYRFAYVILHYGVYEETVKAIESITDIAGETEGGSEGAERLRHIVVVDNASPDRSGERLKDRYENKPEIHILMNSKNEGFAKGNNLGYGFARTELQADFIIVMNNDVEIRQKDFEQKVAEIYGNCSFYVMGPDIVTPQGEHRNPHREDTFSKRDLNRIIRNRTVILWYLKFKQILGLQDRVHFIENWDKRRVYKEREHLQARRDRCQRGIVLHGSFLIFSPRYVEREQAAFCPDTFMYMEEEILTYLCRKKNYLILYDPALQILHKEEAATAETMDAFEKYRFYTENLRNSARVMKGVLSG